MDPQKQPQSNYLPYPPQTPTTADDEIDLRELFKAIWKGKWIIVATTFLFAVASVVYALSLPNIYKADALLAPAENSNGGGLSQMAGQLGGLAALAGVSLGGESSQADLAVQVMKSRKFIESFVIKHDLLVPLMAVEGWDQDSGQLVIDEELYNPDTKDWLREPKGLRGAVPTTLEAYEVFLDELLKAERDSETGLYKVSISYYSPNHAKQWLMWLIDDINKVMRERTIAETSQNLAYLNTQLQKTAVADMQSTFYKLIEEQTKSLMLAEVQEEFAFKVIDPAVTPEEKSEPRRAILCIVGVFFGGFFGVFIVLAKIAVKRIRVEMNS